MNKNFKKDKAAKQGGQENGGYDFKPVGPRS